MKPQLQPSWLAQLSNEFNKPYMQQLKRFLTEQKAQRKIIYPKGKLIFNALNSTPFEQVKVVILGQDPYHGAGQAHGLCFSVPGNIPPPPSLLNIYREINNDLNIHNHSGNLSNWAKQGVLLLNSVLTVEHGKAASHQGQGWEQFTDSIIQTINDQLENIVFMLWGAYAQRKGELLSSNKHLILKAPHPSPLSAHRGFFGCRHFSSCNQYLVQQQKSPIDWQV